MYTTFCSIALWLPGMIVSGPLEEDPVLICPRTQLMVPSNTLPSMCDIIQDLISEMYVGMFKKYKRHNYGIAKCAIVNEMRF